LWPWAWERVVTRALPSFQFPEALGVVGEAASEWAAVSTTLTRDSVVSLWHGVDVLDFSIVTQKGQFMTDDASAAANLLMKAGPLSVVEASAEFKGRLGVRLVSVSERVPRIEEEWERLHFAGLYEHVGIRISLRPSGLLDVAWISANATFKLQWTNPLWDALGFEAASQSAMVSAKIGGVLKELNLTPPPPWAQEEWGDDFPVLLFTRSSRLWRFGRRLVRRLQMGFCSFIDDPLAWTSQWGRALAAVATGWLVRQPGGSR